MSKRIFTIVLDSFGIGNAPDAEKFGDAGANTLKTLYNSNKLYIPNMEKLGLFKIDGMDIKSNVKPVGQYGRLVEMSSAKDTITGHWEMMGIVSKKPFQTFPNGFPQTFIDELSKLTGRPVLCNKPYSGTEVIRDYGKQSVEQGALIVYTSADSVCQIAAHEDAIPLDDLYSICKTARELLVGDLNVGRVIARPFIGEYPNYKRDANGRHDLAVTPPYMLMNELQENKIKVVSIGKIYDIFNKSGIDETEPNRGNTENMNVVVEYLKNTDKFKSGFCFVNLVDFDMLYGHRRDIDGYVNAVNEFDKWLGNEFIPNMQEDDCIMITGDHGCDPGYSGTDHTRETVPLLIYKKNITVKNLGIWNGFNAVADIVRGKLLNEN